MSFIENSKQYSGSELDNTFFRPMLTGQSAEELGIRVLYNQPVPTSVQLVGENRNILQKFTQAGWNGSKAAEKLIKTIDLKRVKAEVGYSAADYFSTVFEKITASSSVNMDDLTGTDLEKAETEIFRRTVAENIRATMWIGDNAKGDTYNAFTGFLPIIEQQSAASAPGMYVKKLTAPDIASPDKTIDLFDDLWQHANPQLQDMKGDGQLAYFVSSDIYYLYEKYLDQKGADAAYVDAVSGRRQLMYHGIPVIDIRVGKYISASSTLPQTFCVLTDRRNLVLAVNTSDFPGTEVRMWYNPDMMENRQRAVFMAGCDVLDNHIVAYACLKK